MTKLIRLVIMVIEVRILPRAGLDKKSIVKAAAELANEIGYDNISLKILAEHLGVRSPSLYNHISGLDELRHELMLYGWRCISSEIISAVNGLAGYDAICEMCRAFYRFASNNKGIFNAMLWYNKYADEETLEATKLLFSIMYSLFTQINIPRWKAEHIIRTFRSFLEGFSLLVNNDSFGHSASIDESFDISLDILIAGMKAQEEKPHE